MSDEQKNPQTESEDTEGHSVSPNTNWGPGLHKDADRQWTPSSKPEQAGDEDDTEGNSFSQTPAWNPGVASPLDKEFSEQQHQADEQ